MLTERDRCRVTFTQPDVLRNTLTSTRVNSQSQWIQRATVQKLCSCVTMGTTYRPPHPPPSNSPPNKCLCQSLMKTLQFWCLEQTVWEDGKGTAGWTVLIHRSFDLIKPLNPKFEREKSRPSDNTSNNGRVVQTNSSSSSSGVWGLMIHVLTRSRLTRLFKQHCTSH